MKRLVCFLLLYFSFITGYVFAQHHENGMSDSGGRKNPALAALLSIQPLPIDIGNFYSGNWQRGIIYTTAETVLFIPAMILLGRNSWSWGMHNYQYYGSNATPRSWTTEERNQFYYLLIGYIAVKIISAFDAGYSAERYNQNLSLSYNEQNNSAMLSLSIQLK